MVDPRYQSGDNIPKSRLLHPCQRSSSMPSMNRREFLHDTTALAAAFAGAGLIAGRSPAAVKKKGDANDQLHVAVIGVNGRGMSHVHDFANKHGCVITTICDRH